MVRKKFLMIGALVAAIVLVGVPYYSYAGETETGAKLVFSYTATCSGQSGAISLVASVDDGRVGSFWAYLSDYWSFESQETIRVDDPKFAVSTTVLFTSEDGTKQWLFQEFEEFGSDALDVSQERAYEVAMLDIPGTYKITVALLLKGAYDHWNMTIAWDAEVVET